MIADRLLEEEGVTSPEEINDYWMAALLHDCGKVVQGFFFSNLSSMVKAEVRRLLKECMS